jgi:hypothetical protein
MMTKPFLVLAATGAAAFGAIQIGDYARPGGWQAFDNATFMRAQKKDKIIVVAVAPGSAQRALMTRLEQEYDDAGVVLLTLDPAANAEFITANGLAHEPGLMVFKGMEEMGRTGGEPDADRLRGMVLAGL